MNFNCNLFYFITVSYQESILAHSITHQNRHLSVFCPFQFCSEHRAHFNNIIGKSIVVEKSTGFTAEWTGLILEQCQLQTSGIGIILYLKQYHFNKIIVYGGGGEGWREGLLGFCYCFVYGFFVLFSYCFFFFLSLAHTNIYISIYRIIDFYVYLYICDNPSKHPWINSMRLQLAKWNMYCVPITGTVLGVGQWQITKIKF